MNDDKLGAVAAQAPSGLVEALERIVDCDGNNKKDTPAFTPAMSGWDTGVGYCADIARKSLAAHKAQPVADVRGMVEALKAAIWFMRTYGYVDQTLASHNIGRLEAALASARHAMGGEVK